MLFDETYSKTKIVGIFTVSSFLYQLGFWSTYDLSVLGLFNFNDILNSFIFPVTLVFPLIVILGFILDYVDQSGKTKSRLIAIITIGLCVLVLVLFFADRLLEKHVGSIRWISYIMFFYGLLNFEKVTNTMKKITDHQSFRKLLLYSPLICFAIGKLQAEEIRNNENSRSIELLDNGIIAEKIKTNNLKLVSIMNDYIVLTDSSNEKLTILKVQDFSVLKK